MIIRTDSRLAALILMVSSWFLFAFHLYLAQYFIAVFYLIVVILVSALLKDRDG